MKMWIETIERLTFFRHDDDEPLIGNPAQFSDSGAMIKDVLDDVCANDCIELVISKWQPLGFTLEKFEAVGRSRRHNLNTSESGYSRVLILDGTQQVTCATADINNGLTFDLGDDAVNTSLRIIGVCMDVR